MRCAGSVVARASIECASANRETEKFAVFVRLDDQIPVIRHHAKRIDFGSSAGHSLTANGKEHIESFFRPSNRQPRIRASDGRSKFQQSVTETLNRCNRFPFQDDECSSTVCDFFFSNVTVPSP